MITLMIAHEAQLVRDGLTRLLADASNVMVVGEASRADVLFARLRRHRPDVLLLDVGLPGMEGIEMTRRALRVAPDVKLVGLGHGAMGPYPMRFFEAGARGFLTIQVCARELVQAIHQVAGGERYVPNEVAREVMLGELERPKAPISCLTPRELSVLMMLSRGCKRKEISISMSVSPKTVSTYRSRLMRKLGVHNDVELAHLCLHHGLVDGMGEAAFCP